MLRKENIFIFVLFISVIGYSQTNSIYIDAQLSTETNQIEIDQKIIYHNNSEVNLDTIYLLNWANSFKDRHTPLSKRLIENYDKSLYFAKIKKRGFSKIKSIKCDNQIVHFENLKDAEDIVKIGLLNTLKPHDSIVISTAYTVKIPVDDYTKYGYDNDKYNLRYWYLSPAVFDGKWHIMSNLNMDDIFMSPSNYHIDFKIPYGYTLNSDLPATVEIKDDYVLYQLEDHNRIDLEISIQLVNDYSVYKSGDIDIISNLKSENLTENIKTDVLKRQLSFIEEYLGKYPHKKLLINKTTYSKNPVYGFNQLPKFLTPFSDVFEWDIKIFKALTNRYIENTITTNKREDTWVTDGIQIYLMIKYVEQFYPEVKAIGDISKIWGVKSYTISKLDFNQKYPFVYQFSARKNIDQSLITRSDSLSNFNRKLANKYKAGLGLQYLDKYLKDSVIKTSLNQFYELSLTKKNKITSNNFKVILESNTDKDLYWFFNDYVQTNKKIDYTIDKIEKQKDSVKVTIKNLRNFTSPVTISGINKKNVIFEKWIEGIDSVKTVTVPTKDVKSLALNYNFSYPELNLRNNWKRIDNKLLNRPLRLTFFKDVEDPYYNQLFYNLYFEYNFYDGIVLGPELYNQAAIKKKWLFHVTPKYGFKSKAVTGSGSFAFQHLPENSSIYKYRAGLAASKSHYNNDLTFNKVTPFFLIEFKRKSLRDVGGKSLMARMVIVDKELPEIVENPEIYKYHVFNIRYSFSKPDIIKDLRYFADFQYGQDFSKLSFDFRYRKLTDKKRQFDFRLFFGTFIFNNTSSDFFSFALDRPNDYMFDLNYLGRSEESGLFSQQIIIAEGGFKSIFENQYSNQWILTTNASIGLWRWLELYADVGLVKNNNESTLFRYDSGIRLNFIHNFLEFYFPIQSSLGFEPGMPNYASKIRFVFTLNPTKIYNFIRRGFY